MCLNFKSRLEGLWYGWYENDGVKNGTKVRTYETLVNFWNFSTGIKPQSSQNWASLRWILQILTTCEIRIIQYRFNKSRGYRKSFDSKESFRIVSMCFRVRKMPLFTKCPKKHLNYIYFHVMAYALFKYPKIEEFHFRFLFCFQIDHVFFEMPHLPIFGIRYLISRIKISTWSI